MTAQVLTYYQGRDLYRVSVIVDGVAKQIHYVLRYHVTKFRNRLCARLSHYGYSQVTSNDIPNASDMIPESFKKPSFNTGRYTL